MLRKTLHILINRYVVATLAFAVWIVFFDNYSLVRQHKLKNDLHNIEEMKRHYHMQIDQNRKELQELETNKKTLEKFAREKYMMKKENEDIFVVIKE